MLKFCAKTTIRYFNLIRFVIVLFSAFFMQSVSSAHGEDKLGPNGGYIKMPGGFHTEVVPSKDGTFKIYLLDINFKTPTIKESSVKAWIDIKNKKIEINCASMRDHFHCFPNGIDLKIGELIILAERNKAKGSEAKYLLPLKLTNTKVEPNLDDHSKH